MPPKNADQRKTSKKGTGAAPSIKRELDFSLYQRKQHELPPLADTLPLEARLTGDVANIETLFPEWTVEGEIWTEGVSPEIDENLRYPQYVDTSKKLTIREILGLVEPVVVAAAAAAPDPKGKGKDSKKPPPAAKKGGGGAAAAEVVTAGELQVDEQGRKLPRVYVEADLEKKDSFEAFPIPRSFSRDWSNEQRQRWQLKKSLLSRIDEAASEEEKELFKSEYEAALADRDVDKEEPNGDDRDPYIVSAFKFIAQFAPAIFNSLADATIISDVTSTKSDSSSMQYLWRSVYPQLANGKPHYNPSGKYCVRIFIAGKWRKVTVSDVVPVDDHKKYSLASSVDSYELWPLILSKAIYTVFSACGYSEALLDTESGPSSGASWSLKSAYFVSNAVYLLTGWQPGTPWSLGETIGYDLPRARSLLEEVQFSGAVTVAPVDIPSEPPKVNQDSILASPENSNRLLTAKQFRDEYSLRVRERGEVVSDINIREERIAKIEAALSKAFSETFAIFTTTTATSTASATDSGGGVGGAGGGAATSQISGSSSSMYPILGLSFPDDSDDLRDVKVLTHWKTGALQRTIEIQRSEDIAKLTEGLDDPFPPTTPIESQWVTFRELISNNAYVVGVDTQTRLPHKAVLGWHWASLEASNTSAADPKAAKGAKKGDKDPKGAAAASGNAPPIDMGCGDIGAFPPALLVLNTSSFFTTVEEVVLPKNEPASPEAVVVPPLVLEGGVDAAAAAAGLSEEAAAALSLQAAELQELQLHQQQQQQNKEPTYIPKDKHLSISIAIQADLPKPPVINISNSLSLGSAEKEQKVAVAAAAAAADPVSNLVASLQSRFVPKLPSDVVLVLQELRTDREDPLVMRLEMSEHAIVPVARATFHIPAGKLRPNEKLVFWVRMFTKASVFLTFGSTVPVVAGELEQVWKDQLRGSVFSREGEAGPTRPHSEQLLFRIPLQIDVTVQQGDAEGQKGGNDAKHGGGGGGGKKKGGKQAEQQQVEEITTVADVEPVDDLATVFLYISDRDIARTISMMLLTSTAGSSSSDNNHKQQHRDEEEGILDLYNPSSESKPIPGDMTYTMPRIQGNVILLSSSLKKIRTLIARCFPPCAGKITVPSFKWKLIVISKLPIISGSSKLDPAAPTLPSPEGPLSQRFSGKYFPNNRLILFRDVLTVPKESGSIAIKLTLHPILGDGALAASAAADMISLESSIDFLDSLATDVDIAEGVNLNVKLFRKGDRKLIVEYHGRSIIPIYNIPVNDFIMDPVKEVPAAAETVAPTKGAKGGAAAKKDEKGGGGGGGGGGGKGGAGKHAVEESPVEIIVECSVDQNTMEVPIQWRSRRPFDFDGILSSVASQASAAASSIVAGTQLPIEGGSSPDASPARPSSPPSRQPNSARAPNSARHYTGGDGTGTELAPMIGGVTAPIVFPQFSWQVDILAGNVLRVSHDMYDLERRLLIKNSWEEASAGRSLKADAAMKYFHEKGRNKALDADDSTSSVASQEIASALEAFPVGDSSVTANAGGAAHASSVASASPTRKSITGKGSTQTNKQKGEKAQRDPSQSDKNDHFIQLLATALEVDLSSVEEREKLLMAREHQYEEHVEPCAPETIPHMIDENTINFQRAREEKDWQETQKLPENLSQKIAKLAKDMRYYAKVRLQRIHEDAIINAQALAEPWKEREKYRLEVDKKNAELAEEIAKNEEGIAAAAAAAAAAAGKKPEKRRSLVKKK